jgi:uncharacterized protein (PEP-CTERM system associated)
MGADRADQCSRRPLRPQTRIPSQRPPARSRTGLTWRAWLAGAGCLVLVAPALAENWRVSASASVTETYTSDVNYASGSNAGGDFATSVGGAIAINGAGARVRLNGSLGATATFYGKESQNNSFAPSVALSGNVEAIENFLFIDGTVSITQTFFSPFGPQPGNLVNATANRYTAQAYSLSPYIRGRYLAPT